jgi:HPt (histidine-containing phosphotransfer) domain-containing protein
MGNEIGKDANFKSEIRNPKSEIKSIPIVAMTAHVIKGDRERCLEAGMNEYVSKPIDSDKLFEAIEKLTRVSGIMKPAPAEPFIADSSLLLKAFDGDWNFLKEVVEVFIDDYPRLIDNLQQSLEEGDCDTFMRSAHSLKGMLINFRADTAAEIAFNLEKKGKAADLKGVRADVDRLATHISEVDNTLRNMIKQQYS